jgi:hypothetical protein
MFKIFIFLKIICTALVDQRSLQLALINKIKKIKIKFLKNLTSKSNFLSKSTLNLNWKSMVLKCRTYDQN